MIKINIKKDLITIKGHSNYSVSGSDIVCASVSSIAITSINAILKIDRNAIKYKKEDGFIEIEVLKNDTIINSLIQNMVELLEELSKQYKKNININK